MQNSKKEIFKTIIIYTMLTIILLISIGPFLWMLSTSLKSSGENIFSYPPKLIPEQFTLSNLKYVLTKIPFSTYFFNSAWIAIVMVVLNVFLSVMAAYPLERMEFKGKNIIFLSIISTMMIPFQVIMIPLFVITVKYNLKNSFIGVILPFSVSAFGIFILRQAFKSIPKTLDEAAYIDGCNSWQLLWIVLFPLIKPALATLAIFTFVNSWSNFLWPLLVLEEKAKYTLPLGLIDLQGAFYSDFRLVSAGAILATIPIIIFFLCTQKYFIEGATDGGVKG